MIFKQLIQFCSRNKLLTNKIRVNNAYFSSNPTRMSKISSKPLVYVTRSDIPKEGFDILKKSCEVTNWSNACAVPRNELLKNIKGKDGLFCFYNDQIDKELLDIAGPNLKVISTMSVGVDHIDLPEIKKRSIKIGHTSNITAATDAVAELTIALLLTINRRLIEANEDLHNGRWALGNPVWMCGTSLSNSIVGIVGFGRIGQTIAKYLQPFNVCKILYNDVNDITEANELNANRVSFDELLINSDFILVSCNLTSETKELFDEKAFCKMKPSAVFVNTSRGGVVKQDDLIKALENKTINAAGLDVMTPEPLPLDNPLLQLKNCVILPHIGSAVINVRIQMTQLAANNILAAINGKDMPGEFKI